MSNPFADTLHLTVQASAAHRIFVVALHIAAAAVVAILAVARPWLIVLLPVIAITGGYAYQTAALGRAGSVRRLRWQYDDQWRWQTTNGNWHQGRLIGTYTAGDWLVVLRLRAAHDRWRTQSCVLFRDALPEHAHRHLRARLTIAPVPGDADSA